MPIEKSRSKYSNRSGGLRWARNHINSFEKRFARARDDAHREIERKRYERACALLIQHILEK